MNQKEIFKFFTKIDLTSRYISLCRNFPDSSDYIVPKKNEIERILKIHNLNLSFSRQEKSFYEDFIANDKKVRFMLGYGYGMISAFYIVWDDKKRILRAELSDIIEELGVDFFSEVEGRYPITKSQQDLEEILEEILSIYKEFKKEFIKQYS